MGWWGECVERKARPLPAPPNRHSGASSGHATGGDAVRQIRAKTEQAGAKEDRW